MDSGIRAQRLLTIHPAYDEKKLEAMKAIGLENLPPVRVVDCGNHYMAIEGSHRLTVAADLRIQPRLIVLAEDDLVDLGTTDIAELFDPGTSTVKAYEIVRACLSNHNPVFNIEPDGTLAHIAPAQEEE
jgi:hypothetical protein